MWWKILKNAKLSGKAKGTTLSANRIKIKKPDDCCEKFWKTIQEFKNEHLIVFRVIGVHLANPAIIQYGTFDGIGHIKYKGDTLVTPMSSKEPCKDSYILFRVFADIWHHFISNNTPPKEWDNYIANTQGNMYPFLPKHYEDATISEIREWPELVIKFLEAFNELNSAFQNCPELERMAE